jgi:hypothetical protein
MGKSTISMAIFNSYVSHYQRVVRYVWIFDDFRGMGAWDDLIPRRLVKTAFDRAAHHGKILLGCSLRNGAKGCRKSLAKLVYG